MLVRDPLYVLSGTVVVHGTHHTTIHTYLYRLELHGLLIHARLEPMPVSYAPKISGQIAPPMLLQPRPPPL